MGKAHAVDFPGLVAVVNEDDGFLLSEAVGKAPLVRVLYLALVGFSVPPIRILATAL
jgi:hypothetical protein